MALLRDENTLTSDLDLDLAATALSEIYYDNSDFEHDTINRDNIILHGDRIEYKGSLKVTDNECSSLKLKNFTLFKVHGDFVCTFCRNLESLEGAPEEVGGSFYCNNSYILSLEGGPRRVKYVYDCSVCPYLYLVVPTVKILDHLKGHLKSYIITLIVSTV